METKSARTTIRSIPRWAYILFIVMAVFLFWRVYAKRRNAATVTQPPARPVAVAKVTTKDVPLYLDEIGTCAAYETVQIQSQVSGQIIARNFQDGADVKKGDPLFTIDPRPYQAALDQAQGQLGQAKSQLILDQITLKRQQDLRARGAVAAAQVNLDYCNIRSPIDGRAGLRNVDVGNVVAGGNGGAVLLTIQQLDPIYTDFTVAETDLPEVRPYLNGPTLKVPTDTPNDANPPAI